jgi:hypothetical protein
LLLRPAGSRRACGRCKAGDTDLLGCATCNFDMCLPCHATASFAAARISDEVQDPYTSHMERSAAVQRLVPDVVGVVLQFACDRASRAVEVGLVCRSWYKGMLADTTLWRQLYSRRWPERKVPRRVSSSLYRSHSLAAMRHLRAGLRAAEELAPIESCDFEFRCPMVAGVLMELADETLTIKANTSDGYASVRTRVSFCDVCKKKVYTASTQEEVDHHRAKGNCIAVHMSKLRQAKGSSQTLYCVLGNVEDGGASAHAHLETIVEHLQLLSKASVERSGLRGRVLVHTSWDITLAFEVRLSVPTRSLAKKEPSCVIIVPPDVPLPDALKTPMTLIADHPAKHAEMLRDQHDIEAIIARCIVRGELG